MKKNAVNDAFRILTKALTKEQLNEIRRDGFLDMGQMQALAEDSGLDIELIQEIVRQMDQVWLMSGGKESEINMKKEAIYIAVHRELWGSYGDILIEGFHDKEVVDGEARYVYKRSGDVVLSLCMSPSMSRCIVTEEFKRKLDNYNQNYFEFKPLNSVKFAKIDWRSWDENADPVYPNSQDHDPVDYYSVCDYYEDNDPKLPKLFLIVGPRSKVIHVLSFDEYDEKTESQYRLRKDNLGQQDIVLDHHYRYLIVNERGKSWLEKNAADSYLEFILVK